MNDRLVVKPTQFAAAQIRKESRWWRISAHPEIGAIAEDSELTGVRRVLLAATQHYLYYRVVYSERRIEVLGVWSTSRGEHPVL